MLNLFEQNYLKLFLEKHALQKYHSFHFCSIYDNENAFYLGVAAESKVFSFSLLEKRDAENQ